LNYLLATQLEIERREAKSKRLKRREWPTEIDVERVLTHSTELQVDCVRVFLGAHLEVLDACVSDTLVKVEHESSDLLIPLGRLVLFFNTKQNSKPRKNQSNTNQQKSQQHPKGFPGGPPPQY
jgi:hypothetical protein